jgi:butyryl-CoA dehydrogenase
VSLFAVPKRRPIPGGDSLEPNDVNVAGVIHKIGWRGIPSLALAFGDDGNCRGWLVGEPHKGISYMFQMMNEARIMVGVNGAATASVAYHEALAYARTRPQGRNLGARRATEPQVPIIAHADVRRMLLRQKAIVEGALALVAFAAMQADLASHAVLAAARERASLFLDTLTPIAKTFPAEWGFEANALALQVHGGYGYSSEQLPEAWLRDQKLNSIHEGTTGIQGLDLLGRKVVAEGGEPIRILVEHTERTIARAERAGIDPSWGASLRSATKTIAELTAHLGGFGMAGDADGMLLHSADYLNAFAIVVVAWLWLAQATVAKEALAKGATASDVDFYEGKVCAAEYWLATELPQVEVLSALCRNGGTGDLSYGRMREGWF